MDYVTRKLRFFLNIFEIKTKKSTKAKEATRYEIYFEYIYMVLSWDDSSLTLGVFLVLNFLFWLIVQWQIKFFGILFLTILLGFIWDSYFHFQIKEYTVYQGQDSEAFDEICSFVSDIIFTVKMLRKESPSAFCIGMSLVFLSISVIARCMSGYLFTYLTMLGVFFIPLGFKVLPEEYVVNVREIMKSISSTKGVLAEEELIPFISNKDFTKKDTDLDSLLTDKTADSVSNSLISGISSMPSYLDVIESRDCIEEEDLLPTRKSQAGDFYSLGELSTDSDSEHREINFDSTHFNGNTSSEEENLLGKGLKFCDITDGPRSRSAPQTFGSASERGFSGMLGNIANLSSSLMANVIKTTVSSAPNKRKNSSSDSEFEIIDSEDI